MTQPVFKNGLAVTAGTITIYNIDTVTGEFLCISNEFIPVGVGLPAHSTSKKPAAEKAGFARCFRGGKWQDVEDRRGRTYYSITDGSRIEVTELGAIGDGYVSSAPATAFDVWNGSEWITDTVAGKAAAVAQADEEKQQRLNAAAVIIETLKDAEAGGFIEEEDKAKLTAWLKYRYQLLKIDTTTAPDIEWPEAL